MTHAIPNTNYTPSDSDRTPPDTTLSQALPELTGLTQWVGWRAEPKPDGKATKVPINPRTGANASTSRPTTWGSYLEAQAAVGRYGLDGIGFVLTEENNLTGVDLDDCIREDGTLAPLAQHIVDRAASYTYITPSGKGLRVMLRGQLPHGRAVASPEARGLEAYCQKRFFTVGGAHWPGTPHEINEGGELLTGLAGPLRQLQAAANAIMAAPQGTSNTIFNATVFRIARDRVVDRELAEEVLLDAADIRQVENSRAVFAEAWAAGEREQPVRRREGNTTQDHFEALEELGWEFRMNELDDSIETNNGPWTDTLQAVVHNAMMDQGFNSAPRITNAVVEAAYRQRYHPIRDYLGGLEWDGEDHISRLLGHLTTPKPEWARAALTRWLVGAVAKAYEGGQNAMLVLTGPQGQGKSALVRFLCPLPEYFVEAPVQPDNKDDLVRLIRTWVWEVGELGATTRRADREALKHFISLRDVTVRKPYGKGDIRKPALASLIGTVNDDGTGFLTDPTGNRRFWVVELEKIDWGYRDAVNPAGLWAQATALYQAGEPWMLSAEETAMREAENARYESDSALAQFFFKAYKLDPTAADWILASDIIQNLEMEGMKMRQTQAFMELSALMKKYGVKKGKPGVEGPDGRTARVSAYTGLRHIGQGFGTSLMPADERVLAGG